ncbi:hypothetical protein NDU88_007867 [Pleurodeles waltl]|uniref:Claudin n=1 Tax=Pleurodeles waltl TaxID=8319 RepID=A0AAV7NUI8_PLEWA|nr:hypothetical protein NDU88_007867 [Pleurodeles waltl]
MAGCIIHIIGLILGAVAIILTFVVIFMNQWRVTTIVETNPLTVGQRVDGQWINRWEGLWFTCITEADTEMRCDGYGSMVSVTTDIKAARILIPFALVIAIISFIMAIVGILLYFWCCQYGCAKRCLLLTGGIGFMLAAILMVIPVSWIAANITVQVYDLKCKTVQKIEMGEAIFLAWPTILFLLLAGILLCCQSSEEESCQYIAPKQQTSYVECPQERKLSVCEPAPLQQQCTPYTTHLMDSKAVSCEDILPRQQSACAPQKIDTNFSSCEYLPRQHNTYVNQQIDMQSCSSDDIPRRQQKTYLLHQNKRKPLNCEDSALMQQKKCVGHQLQRKASSMHSKSLYI